ncbi:hypothetical protein ACP6EP_00475 [Achromobacter xylosoxidans]|uniref:hypothetical protein n=1 Tax=Alcaligenes xylosoxydans xylosoxydans TaxID=85698 RepID=UPI003CF615B3
MNSRLLTRRIKRDRAIHERIVWLPIAQDIAMPLSALLHTTDLAATRDFYGSALGFTVTDSAEGTLTVEQHGGRLIFTTLDLWKRAPGFSGTPVFLASRCRSVLPTGQGQDTHRLAIATHGLWLP